MDRFKSQQQMKRKELKCLLVLYPMNFYFIEVQRNAVFQQHDLHKLAYHWSLAYNEGEVTIEHAIKVTTDIQARERQGKQFRFTVCYRHDSIFCSHPDVGVGICKKHCYKIQSKCLLGLGCSQFTEHCLNRFYLIVRPGFHVVFYISASTRLQYSSSC